MMRIFVPLLFLTALIPEKEHFRMTIYSQGKVVKELKRTDFSKVDIDKQCYTLKNKDILNNVMLYHGDSIVLTHDNTALFTAIVADVYDSHAFPNNHFIIIVSNNKIAIDKGLTGLCFWHSENLQLDANKKLLIARDFKNGR